MSDCDEQKNDKNYLYKCRGISMDSNVSLSYEDITEGLTNEEILKYQQDVVNFLKKEGFGFLIDCS